MQTGKIKTRCCSPVNRILLLFYKKVFYHLSSPAVTHRIQLPTPSGKAPASNKRDRNRSTGIYLAFQLARFTPKIYCYISACALTTRFHPYPP